MMVVKVLAFPVIVSCAACDGDILIENQHHYVTVTGWDNDFPVNSYICESCMRDIPHRVVDTVLRQRGQVG